MLTKSIQSLVCHLQWLEQLYMPEITNANQCSELSACKIAQGVLSTMLVHYSEKIQNQNMSKSLENQHSSIPIDFQLFRISQQTPQSIQRVV